MMQTKGRGRPLIYATDAERAAARATSKAKSKNITIDADLVEALHECSDKMAEKLGFRPTMSQTLRHLIKSAQDTP